MCLRFTIEQQKYTNKTCRFSLGSFQLGLSWFFITLKTSLSAKNHISPLARTPLMGLGRGNWWARHPTCAYLVSRSPVRLRSIPFVFTSIQLYREGGAKNSASRQLSWPRSQPRCFVLSSLFLFLYHPRCPQTWSTRCWDLQRLQWLCWFAVRSESSLQECRSNSDCPEFYRFVKDEANQLVCAEKGSTNFLFVIPVPTCKRFINVIIKTFFYQTS